MVSFQLRLQVMGTLKVCWLFKLGQLFHQIAYGSFPKITCLRNDAVNRDDLISNSQTS